MEKSHFGTVHAKPKWLKAAECLAMSLYSDILLYYQRIPVTLKTEKMRKMDLMYLYF